MKLIYATAFPLFMIAAAAMPSTSCGGGGKTENDSIKTTPADSLRQRLLTITDAGKVVFGHHDDPVYGHTWAWDKNRSDVLEVCGDYPGMINWDLGGIETDSVCNLDGVPFDRMRAEVIANDSRGGINSFSWHLVNPVNLADSWGVSNPTIVSHTLNDSTASARFDLMITRAAEFINSLRRPDGSKIPVIFRPWHEHTGSWFWWGQDLCSADDYKALWQRTRRGFDRVGVDNVLWVYSPDRVDSQEKYLERYPGDEYVDIMGCDIYHYGGAEGVDNYRASVDVALTAASQAASAHGKLFAFSETGSEGLPMADWWTEVLLPVLRTYRPAYVTVWRNAHDKPGHYYAPFAGEPSSESFNIFYNDTITAFAGDMQKFY